VVSSPRILVSSSEIKETIKGDLRFKKLLLVHLLEGALYSDAITIAIDEKAGAGCLSSILWGS